MRRTLALGALVALVVAGLAPASQAAPRSIFALAGEARALELSLFDQGLTLGLALSRGDSTPSASGVAAGQCAVLGDEAGDPDSLPCTEANTEISAFPGNLGDTNPSCSLELPAPLNTLVDLKTACGQSQSGIDAAGFAFTKNKGTVAELSTKIPVSTLLPVGPVADETVDTAVDTLTGALTPVLDALPQEVEGAVEQVIETVENITEQKVLQVEIGTAESNVIPNGDEVTVSSLAAGARIGILGIPGLNNAGDAIAGTADPLENGLVIIEVGAARASATVNEATGLSSSTADPAIVRVKIRDILSPTPKYLEIAVAPGQTVTLLEGTPLESTITAADSQTSNTDEGATAAADAVRLHLLKGVNGGLKLGLGRATAAANIAPKPAAVPPGTGEKPAPPAKRPPVSLPVTGGTDLSGLAIMLVLGSAGAMVLRRRFSAGSNN
ncbi:MAG TPA: hypothetical protein VNC78_01710 [Actinomycetota bacterium]|nr:hypothetical protein [Actinomycetota bacterium]